MPIHRKAQGMGVFSATEIALFRRVFDRSGQPGETEAEREARASRIIANYMAGIEDEAELIALSMKPLGR
jgi:hypothetical protein